VKKHVAFVGEAGQIANLPRRVNGTHFADLSNRDDAGLNVMLVANAVIGMADRLEGELTIGGRNRNEFASGEFLGRATFVGVDVGRLGADHCMIGFRHRLQA
jgi:hypothetical protein